MMKQLRSFCIGLSSFLVFWWLLSKVTNNRSLPNPIDTLQRFWELKSILFLSAGASLLRITAALGLALVIGVPLGIWLSRSVVFGKLFGPLIYFLYPLPKVAFLPVFMIFFGLGNQSKILLLVAIILLQVIVSIRDGVNRLPEEYYQVLENYSHHWQHKLRYVILPGVLPSLFASLRVSIGIALASLFFAENYNTMYGLGYLILSAWSKMDYEQMLSGVLMIALLGFVIFSAVDLLEKACCRYL